MALFIACRILVARVLIDFTFCISTQILIDISVSTSLHNCVVVIAINILWKLYDVDERYVAGVCYFIIDFFMLHLHVSSDWCWVICQHWVIWQGFLSNFHLFLTRALVKFNVAAFNGTRFAKFPWWMRMIMMQTISDDLQKKNNIGFYIGFGVDMHFLILSNALICVYL